MSARILHMPPVPRSRMVWRGHADVLRQELQSMAALLTALGQQAATAAAQEMPQIRAGIWTLDTGRLELRGPQPAIALTVSEAKLLQALMENPNRGMARATLLRRLYEGGGTDLQVRNVDAHLMRLRRKLGKAAECLATVRGVGFCWHVPTADVAEVLPCR